MSKEPELGGEERRKCFHNISIFDLGQCTFNYYNQAENVTTDDLSEGDGLLLTSDYDDSEYSSQSSKYESNDQNTDDEGDKKNDKFHCNTCILQFEDREELVRHLKCALHIYNLRLKVYAHRRFEFKPIDEYELEELCDILHYGERGVRGEVTEKQHNELLWDVTDDLDIDLLINSLEYIDLTGVTNADNQNRDVKINPKRSPFIKFSLKGQFLDKSNNLNSSTSLTNKILHVYTELVLNYEDDAFKMMNHNDLLTSRLRNLITTGDPFTRSLNNDQPYLWLIVLYRSGYFAASTLEALTGKIITSKSVQRYTVRRKQGGSQASSDKKGTWARSAGAQLRRHNEQLLKEDIKKIFNTIYPYIKRCSLIFIGCSATLRSEILYKEDGDPGYLSANDKRIRYIPFTTYRPTTREILRCYSELSKARFLALRTSGGLGTVMSVTREIDIDDIKKSVLQIAQLAAKGSKKSHINNGDTKLLEGEYIANKALKCVARDKLSSLKKLVYLELKPSEMRMLSGRDECNFMNTKLVTTVYKKLNGISLLHFASRKGSLECLNFLLRAGADPSVKDNFNRTPFEVAKNRNIRRAFITARKKNPDMLNWEASCVPITPDPSDDESVITSKKETPPLKKKRPKKQKPFVSSKGTNVKLEAPESTKTSVEGQYKIPNSRRITGLSASGMSTLDTLDEQQTKEYLRQKALLAAMKRLTAMNKLAE